MNRNQKLFFYGLKVRLFQLGSFVLMMIGILTGFIISKLCFAFAILGLILFILAQSMDFDYQKKSGTIIHKGEGWGR